MKQKRERQNTSYHGLKMINCCNVSQSLVLLFVGGSVVILVSNKRLVDICRYRFCDSVFFFVRFFQVFMQIHLEVYLKCVEVPNLPPKSWAFPAFVATKSLLHHWRPSKSDFVLGSKHL